MRLRPQLAWIAALLACGAAIALAWAGGEHWAQSEAQRQGERQLQLIAPELESALEKFETLPFVIGYQQDMLRVLAAPADAGAVARANATLQDMARQAKVGALYLMDRDGDTLAASNWNQPLTFVGRNFGYRPYFSEALAGKAGRFYGVGTTTGEPGYFIAQPVPVHGPVRGVIAVKISLADIARNWSGSEDTLALADAAGIIFLSNRPDWVYHSLRPLPAEVRADLARTHQYALHAITPLAAPGVTPLTRPVGRLGWQLMLFPSPARVTRTAILWSLAAGLFLVSAGGIGWAMHQRRRRLEERRVSAAALQRAAQELDARIAEGTRQLRQTNQDLEHKVAALKQTETMLRSTQDELVQAGKLAMLGQMAAGMTHELNQPLAAVRAFADNARTFLERGQEEGTSANLRHIADACARMGAIISQLKGFARKGGSVGAVDLATSVRASALLLQGDIQRVGAQLQVEVGETPVQVMGDSVRIEQVLINLLRNALDAVEGQPRRQVTIALEASGGQAQIHIRDSGPGIPEQVAARMGEPFFTTKPSGKGLGLGLAISSSIVQAMGGELKARNQAAGGAEFNVVLPLQREGDGGAGNPG